MSQRFRRSAACGLVVLAVPAAAFAAAPKKNAHFDQRTSKQTFIDFDVSKDGKTIQNFSSYRECNPVPFKTQFKFKIKSGKFGGTTKATDVLNRPFTIVLKGKFTSATKATGTVQISRAGCTGKVHPFAAKYDASVPAGQPAG